MAAKKPEWTIEEKNGVKMWVHRHNGKGRIWRKYGPEGYDAYGYDKKGFDRNGIHKDTGTRYNPSGKDVEGRDTAGFKGGVNLEGFQRTGMNTITGTKTDDRGYNIYGLDHEGRNKEGVKDDDVLFLEDFCKENCNLASWYAKELGVSETEVRRRLKNALKVAPALKSKYKETVRNGVAKQVAVIRMDVKRVKNKEDMKIFCKKHPRIHLNGIRKLIGFRETNRLKRLLAEIRKEEEAES